MNAVEIDSLSKDFGRKRVLSNVSFGIPRKAVFGLLGPNGAGKSTIIKIIANLFKPSSGRVYVNGFDVFSERVRALEGLRFVSESPSMYNHLTASANLLIAAKLYGVDQGEIPAMLELVGLRGEGGQTVGAMSLGMRQRLAIARALLGNPSLLLLDEPMNGIDPEGLDELRELIISLPAEKSLTVMMSSHLLSEVHRACSHVALIKEGGLLYAGDLTTFLSTSDLSALFRVDDVKRALSVLSPGARASTDWTDGIDVDVGSEEGLNSEIARVNAFLISAGVNVFHVELRGSALENVYKDRVRGNRSRS